MVDNGKYIDPFEDNWIPTLSNEMVGRRVGQCFSSFKVEHLIGFQNRVWREPLV